MLLQHGELDAAEAEIAEAQNLQPGAPLVLVYRAWLSMKRGDTDEAKLLIRHAQLSDPKLDIAVVLASKFRIKGVKKPAKLLRKIKRIEPEWIFNPRVAYYESRSEFPAWQLLLLERER